MLCLDCDPIIRNENPFEKGDSFVKKIPSPSKGKGIRILLYENDFDVTGLGYKKSVIPGMETSVFTADTELVEMAKEACEIVNPEIQCFVGRVVTGDQFISDNGTKAALVKDYDGYCAEMEGASMAQVATLNKIPFVIIRAISDKADNSAPVAYETFEEQAIVHTVKLLAAMFLKMSK